MTELTLKTNSAEYNANTLGKQIIHEEYNSAVNHPVLVKAYREGRARDIGLEPKVKGDPCFVLGSGPSLEEVLPKLKEWKGGIICTTSHALSLMYYGIEPTYILALDPFNCWAEIDGVDWSKTKTKLITTPGVWPTLIANWPNEFLLYLQNLGSRETYYSQGQKRMYTIRRPKNPEDAPSPQNPDGICRDAIFDFIIRTEITQFACSPPCQMFAAQILGYGRIFLAGMDFGGSTNWDRFANFTVEEPARFAQVGNAPDVEIPAKWKRNEHPLDPNEEWVTSENGLRTNAIMLFYKKNLITAWRLSLQDVYLIGESIITEMPKADIDRVIATQGYGFKRMSHDWIIRTSERYLAKVSAFVINVGGAYSFVESMRPLENWLYEKGQGHEGELITFMKVIDRKYVCEKCQAVGQAEDDKDWSGATCKSCGSGKMKKAGDIDIAANIKKFRKLLGVDGPLDEKVKALRKPLAALGGKS